ncbi:MAG: uracil-DNA glycosylase [Oscillospiraceae bacterium]|nr:uracil-DNA glycosylase [Oscillospiraceae bacterium]
MSKELMNDREVNCFKCRHFTITWESKFPKACNLYEFKSAQMPSLTVFKTTGSPCAGFEEKVQH